MADVDDADAAALQFGDEDEESFGFLGGERGGGFIHDENAGVEADGFGDFDGLLLGDGEIGDARLGIDRDVEAVEEVEGLAVLGGGGEKAGASFFAAEEEIFAGGEGGTRLNSW